MYDIGILGGMGPLATSVMFDLLVKNTVAECDQEHLSILVANKTSIPDRTAYLLKLSSKNPLPYLIDGVQELNKIGSKQILIPCNTSHYFIEEMQAMSPVPIRNMVLTALNYIDKSDLSKSVVVLGTLGTVKTKIYDKFKPDGLTLYYPNEADCRVIHEVIYTIKKNGGECLDKCADRLNAVISSMQASFETSPTFLFGCTELSVLNAMFNAKENIIDAMEIIALTAITAAGKSFNNTRYDEKIICSIV